MAKVVTPVTAIVECIGRPKQSSYGDGVYHPCLFLDEAKSGEEAKIWKSLSEEEVSQLRKGDRVQLVPAGKNTNGTDKHNIVKLGGSTSATNSQPTTANSQQQGMTAEQKRAIAAYVEQMGDLYAFCLSTAQNKIGASTDGETVRCMASSLFIASQRKFGL